MKRRWEEKEKRWDEAWTKFANDEHVRLDDIIFNYKLECAKFKTVLLCLKEQAPDNIHLQTLIFNKAAEDGLIHMIRELFVKTSEQ